MSKQFYFYFKQFSLAQVELSSIWPIDRTLSSATTPARGDLRAMAMKGALPIPQSSSITWISTSDCLVS